MNIIVNNTSKIVDNKKERVGQIVQKISGNIEQNAELLKFN